MYKQNPEHVDEKTIANEKDQEKFNADFNYEVPINTKYWPVNLGKVAHSSAMQVKKPNENPNDLTKGYSLLRIENPEIAKLFSQGEIRVNAGITPIYPVIIRTGGGSGVVGGNHPARSMEKIVPGSYIDQTVQEIIIPPSVKIIGDGAFKNFPNLRRVVIPEGVTNIGEEAFCGCSQLREISIPNSVRTIGQSAFRACSQLRQIVIPNNVTEIPIDCFGGCRQLSQVTFPQGLKVISAYAFSCCENLTQLSFPDSLTTIRYFAFEQCSNLRQIVTGQNLTKIGECVFSGCNHLDYVHINSPKVCLGHLSFQCCLINNLRIPANIKHICDGSFTCTRVNNIIVDLVNGEQVTLDCQNSDINFPLDPEHPDQKILRYNRMGEELLTSSVYIYNYEPTDVEYSSFTEDFEERAQEEQEQQEREAQGEEEEEEEEREFALEEQQSDEESEHIEHQNNEQQQPQFNFNLDDVFNRYNEQQPQPNFILNDLISNSRSSNSISSADDEPSFIRYSGSDYYDDDDKK